MVVPTVDITLMSLAITDFVTAGNYCIDISPKKRLAGDFIVEKWFITLMATKETIGQKIYMFALPKNIR